MYKKRAGTSGISGQLYETKLISLILFRLQHDDNVHQFYLASNMDDVGAFDDICFRAKIAGHEQELMVFIQAKHKDDDDTFLSYDLVKHFYVSYLNVKQNFYTSKNVFFRDKFEDVECLFILYTNAKYYDQITSVESDRTVSCQAPLFKQLRRKFQSPFADKLNYLISTGDKGSQANYNDRDLDFVNEIILEEEITALAEHFTKFLNDNTNQSMNIMLDKYMLRYHVILAESVVYISEVQSEDKKPEKWRHLTFKPDFFSSTDKVIQGLRKKLCGQIGKTKVRNRKANEIKFEPAGNSGTAGSVDQLISSFLSEPSAITLSPLIGIHIICKSGILKFLNERSDSDIEKLELITISQSIIDEAEEIVARNILMSLKLRVPVTFGNLDLTIGGNEKKVDKRLTTLTGLIDAMCKKSISMDGLEIVIVDETVGDGFLNLNGGIGGTVGNLLVYNKATKLLKVTQNFKLLDQNARTLYDKLNKKINNLHLYRFDVKTVIAFPKLVFDYTNEAKLILNKVVIYEKQCNHNGVEDILKQEMELHHRILRPHNFPVKSDTMIIYYHNEIQKLWMAPKTGPYLTKTKNLYQQSINNIVTEPQISTMQTTYYMNNIQHLELQFNESATSLLKSSIIQPHTVIVTDIFTLTTAKVIQCVKFANSYAVFDLERMLNMPIEDYNALIAELKNTDKLLIAMCNITKTSRTLFKVLDKFTQAIEDKTTIIITNNWFLETVQEYFPQAKILHEEKQVLIDLTPKSQRDIIKNAQIIFQGQEVRLELLVDDVSVTFIKGDVLNKILNNETFAVGRLLTTPSYEEVRHLYVNRNVSQDDIFQEQRKIILLRTFNDISDDVVLITATPGMGKTTLLTHLSLETKKIDTTLWIVRVNLLEHSKAFHNWKINRTAFDTLEMLKFMCHIIVNNNNIELNLKYINGKPHLDNCTDENSFELNMFLHYYNEKKVLFIFDGFDEICPHYKDVVLSLFNGIINYPRKHKMWVASRPCSEILPDLERILGKPYKIDYINPTEQKHYLNLYWQENLIVMELNDIQISHVLSFIDFIKSKKFVDRFDRISYLFYDYLYFHFPHIDTALTCKSIIRYQIVPNSSNLRCGFINDREDIIMGTPLLLYLSAEYFVNLIKIGKDSNDWKCNIEYSTSSVYEMFIETKLKTILYEHKNKMDVYNPDIIKRYEKDYRDCIDIHKKLAAYALIFNIVRLNEFKDMLPFNEELKEYDDVINEIKKGTEKTGLISHVTTDNVPVFIHRTLAEYFTAEYVCDIFKSDKFDFAHKNILFSVAYITFNVYLWISKKRVIDDKLDLAIRNIESRRPNMVQFYCNLFSNGWSGEHLIRINSSVEEDYESDCFSEYNYNNIKGLKDLEPAEALTTIVELQKNIIAKMKPQLRIYFNNFPEL